MDLKQVEKPTHTGTYKANVVVHNTSIDLCGTFDLPVANRDDLREIVEQAIRGSIKIFVSRADCDPQSASETQEG